MAQTKMYESDPQPEQRDGQFCRLCFNKAVDLCPLFPSADIPNKALLHKIFDCTTITLSVRDDHDANICANCILSIEAFFKYKSKCVENDRLLRKKRISFFAGLGLAAEPGDLLVVGGGDAAAATADHSFQSAATILPQQSKRRRLSRNGDLDGELEHEDEEEEQAAVGGKRHRAGLPDDDDDDEGSNNSNSSSSRSIKKPHNAPCALREGKLAAKREENGGEEIEHKVDLGPYQIKQEVIDPDGEDEDENRNQQREHHLDDDDDEEEYFNPNQFLAQETQIDDGDELVEDDADQEISSDGEGQFVPNGGGMGATGGHPSFERGWKTTEFAPQPGSSGLKTLKITDYSNITGKRGRPQRFVTEMLSMAAAAAGARAVGAPGGGSSMIPYHPGDAMYQQFQRLKGLSIAVANATQGSAANRVLGGVIEPTKKVQKFLDDGLRELIYNAGAPNPHYARDGGSTDFKVVKARFNSYNIIFDDNRFLRRNKSVSGLPKWYWACSVTGCPVKICSYAGRLFKTNELSHTHPPTEPDADSKYETIHPDPIEAEQLQRQLLFQQQQQHQLQQQRLLRQQQQQQLLRQRQVELAQRRVAAAAALMAAASANKSRNDSSDQERSRHALDGSSISSSSTAEQNDPRRNYELRMGNDGSEMLLYAGHTHGLIMTRKDGVRVYRCTSVVVGRNESGEAGRPCTDTVFLHVNGRIAKVCKEDNVNYDMELPLDGAGFDQYISTAVVEGGEDEKRRRPQKIIVYEGYRYKYCHARPEGSFYWRCVLRHDKDCLASIQTKRNLEFLNVNDQPHNHEAPDPSEPHENAMLCEIRLPAKGEAAEGSTDFKLVKSGQKREFLIYKGYRYYFQYESKNGRRSYRCTMFKNCPAGAFLLPNSTIQEAKNFIHTHPPVEDMDKYITKDSLITSPIKLPTDGGMDGGKRSQDTAYWKHAPMGGVGTTIGGIEPLSKDPEVARRNGYRIIKNYKNKEIMIYLGWRYFEDYKKKSGGQVWRCSSHRLCRGSVHLFPDGSINFAKLVDHNHSPPKKIISHSSVDGGGYAKPALLDGSPLELASGAEGNGESPLAGGGTYHRYITHQGHRFRFATRKREGTIYWRCAMRLETKCPVSFHTKEDTYELVSTRNHEHNHPVPTVWPEVAGGQIEEELPKVRLPAEEVGTMDFILTKNSKGRDLVLYRNGRFYLDYSRKDGKIVFRCSAVSGCRATVLLLPNKTLQVPEDFNHNHPTADGWQATEATLDGKAVASLGQQMMEPIELKSDDDDEETPSAAGGRPRTSGSGQELILPKIILYDGFQYRFISRHPTEQTAFFRCFNFDAKKNQCHASLYTDLNGVVIQTNQQPHNHEQGDYLMGPDKYHQQRSQHDQPSSPQRNGDADLRGTRDYKIVKNWKNRDVLVFQNCRYFLHYVRKDGRKVWRCSAIRSCHAAVYLNADGTVDQVRGQHMHEIRPEGEPRRRRRRKKSEQMPFSYGAVAPGTGNIFATGGMLANAAELMARGINGASMLNGGGAAAIAGMSHAVNGSMNGVGHNGANEWIDYSDYGIRMSGSPSDTAGSGSGGSASRANEENHSLWDQFHPSGGEGGAFDLNYHSVFGSQESFNTYAVHALAQHHLQQQQQQQQQRSAASLQQRLQHQLLMNGGGQGGTQPMDSSDSEEFDQSGGASGDEHPMIDITPEVKIEGDEL